MRITKTVKWVVAIVCAVALAGASFAWYATGSGDGNGNVVAVINDTSITRDDFHEQLEAEHGMQVLQGLIMQTVVLDEAEEAGVAPDDEEVEEEIDALKAEFGGEQGLNQILQQQGMTMEGLRTNIKMNVALEELSKQEVDFTEEELQEYYSENKEDFMIQERVRASHILLGNKDEAEDIRAELEDGASFSELAERYSVDTASAEDGGELGMFPRGSMVPEFEEIAFELEIGEISEPVETEHGFHIIKVTERQESEMREFDEVRDEVIDQYQREHGPDPQEIMEQLQEEADVEIKWDDYQQLPF